MDVIVNFIFEFCISLAAVAIVLTVISVPIIVVAFVLSRVSQHAWSWMFPGSDDVVEKNGKKCSWSDRQVSEMTSQYVDLGDMRTQLKEELDNPGRNNFILLEGPNGTGKNMLVDVFFRDKNIFQRFDWVQAVENDQFLSVVESRLASFHQDAVARSKSSPGLRQVLYIRNIEQLCVRAASGGNGYQDRLGNISALQQIIGSLKKDNIILICTTSRMVHVPSVIKDSATRILFKLPDEDNRAKLLNRLKASTPMDVGRIVELTSGWTVRSLSRFMGNVKRLISKKQSLDGHVGIAFDKAAVSMQEDFTQKYPNAVLTMPKYSAVVLQNPLSHLKVVQTKLKAMFVQLFRSMTDLNFQIHFLLTGPSGNGKSHAVKAFISQSSVPFVHLRSLPSEIMGSFKLSDFLQDVKSLGPSILFMDEVDTSLVDGSAYSGEMQSFISGAEENSVHLIAATNKPQRLSAAMMDRFTVVEVDYLNKDELKHLLVDKFAFLNREGLQKDEYVVRYCENDFELLARICVGLSIREIEKIAHEIQSNIPVNLDDYCLTMQLIFDIIKQYKKPSSDNALSSQADIYANMMAQYGLNASYSPPAHPLYAVNVGDVKGPVFSKK